MVVVVVAVVDDVDGSKKTGWKGRSSIENRYDDDDDGVDDGDVVDLR